MATFKPTNQLVYWLTNYSFLNNQLFIDIDILPILCSSCAVSCRSSHYQIPASLLGFHQRNNERFHHLCLALTEAFYYISPSTFSLVLFHGILFASAYIKSSIKITILWESNHNDYHLSKRVVYFMFFTSYSLFLLLDCYWKQIISIRLLW